MRDSFISIDTIRCRCNSTYTRVYCIRYFFIWTVWKYSISRTFRAFRVYVSISIRWYISQFFKFLYYFSNFFYFVTRGCTFIVVLHFIAQKIIGVLLSNEVVLVFAKKLFFFHLASFLVDGSLLWCKNAQRKNG